MIQLFLSKWCFSVTTDLISFMTVTISDITRGDMIRFKFQSVDFLYQNPDSQKIENRRAFLLTYVVNQCHIPLQLQAYISSARPQLKTSLLHSRIRLKTIDNSPCSKFLIVQNFQRIIIRTDSSRWLKRSFSVTIGLISFMTVSLKNHKLKRRSWLKFQSSGSLYQNPDSPKHRTVFFIALYRNSNWSVL